MESCSNLKLGEMHALHKFLVISYWWQTLKVKKPSQHGFMAPNIRTFENGKKKCKKSQIINGEEVELSDTFMLICEFYVTVKQNGVSKPKLAE